MAKSIITLGIGGNADDLTAFITSGLLSAVVAIVSGATGTVTGPATTGTATGTAVLSTISGPLNISIIEGAEATGTVEGPTTTGTVR